MPTLTVTKNYSNGNGLDQTMLDTAFQSIESFLNATKLDSSNLQSAAVGNAQLAVGSVDSNKLAASSVLLASLATEVASKLVPTGALSPYAGDSAPTGYLMCDGSLVSRITYATLFGVIGTRYGTGDGSTTFAIPDVRGRFLRGRDAGAGRDLNAASRTAQSTGGAVGDLVGSVQAGATALPVTPYTLSNPGDHTHNFGADISVDGAAHNRVSNGNVNAVYGITTSAAGSHTHTLTGGDLETRPVNTSINYIIKT